ncbi:odorant receptor Or2-like [Cylas formicarius]|uniref:odorant receptor Or2-like n=1 Tax=Cylas formicarius TaxID=197179 RepID=UPI0029588B9B|nr:odorant receptor Or2-like [Cylas formicarius]
MQTHSTLLLATFYGWFVGLVLICYAGHRLMEKSVALGDEIYLKSTWDDLDKGAQIDFAFVLLRSQKPLVLRGGPLAIMSLNVIIQVLKAAMSYITLLRETQEV